MTTTETAIKMVLDRWNGSIKNWNKYLDALTDEGLQQEVAPGRNRGIYLLGHLIAVHDDMLVLLDMGEKQYPGLYEPFLKSADRAVDNIPSAAELRGYWTRQCAVLEEKFLALKPEQWFDRHTAVSPEEFVKELHRNKLNIIITRTSHLQYHTGQLALLK